MSTYLKPAELHRFLWGGGTDEWGTSITGPLAVLGGSPPGSWSIGFETDGFARAATAPVRPCVHPSVYGGSLVMEPIISPGGDVLLLPASREEAPAVPQDDEADG